MPADSPSPNSNSVLTFEAFGELASRVFLTGWCGPLHPPHPSDGWDHRKRTVTWTDCASPDTVEGYVVTFTHTAWSRGVELVFETTEPPGVPELARASRTLSWEAAWIWISPNGGGVDLARPEAWARGCEVLARSLGAQPSLYGGRTLRWDSHAGTWTLLGFSRGSGARWQPPMWEPETGTGWCAARGQEVGRLPTGQEHGPSVLQRLLLTQREAIAALTSAEVSNVR